MSKKFIILLLFVTLYGQVNAQDLPSVNRWKVKAAYVKIDDPVSKGLYQVEGLYGSSSPWEIGAYVGVHFTKQHEIVIGEAAFTSPLRVPYYGIMGNYKIFPRVMGEKEARFNLYAGGKLGGYFISTPENYSPFRGAYWECNPYVGLEFYPIKALGIYAEYGFINESNRFDEYRSSLRFGLSVRWKR